VGDFSLFYSGACEYLQETYSAFKPHLSNSGRKSILCSRIYQIKDVDFMVASGKEAFVSWTLDEKCPAREKRKLQSQWLGLGIESKFILPTCFGIPSLKNE